MDGFPNGRRLEDDVTTIELQAVSGVVLAAIGISYDDYTPGQSPVTPNLVKVLSYNAGPSKNDKPFSTTFPYQAQAHSGYDAGNNSPVGVRGSVAEDPMGLTPPAAFFMGTNAPNPFNGSTAMRFHTAESGRAIVRVYDAQGSMIATIYNDMISNGDHNVTWRASDALPSGVYVAVLELNGRSAASTRLVLQH